MLFSPSVSGEPLNLPEFTFWNLTLEKIDTVVRHFEKQRWRGAFLRKKQKWRSTALL